MVSGQSAPLLRLAAPTSFPLLACWAAGLKSKPAPMGSVSGCPHNPLLAARSRPCSWPAASCMCPHSPPAPCALCCAPLAAAQEAEGAERSQPPMVSTCRAIVREVVGHGVEEEDRKRTWMADAGGWVGCGRGGTALLSGGCGIAAEGQWVDWAYHGEPSTPPPPRTSLIRPPGCADLYLLDANYPTGHGSFQGAALLAPPLPSMQRSA